MFETVVVNSPFDPVHLRPQVSAENHTVGKQVSQFCNASAITIGKKEAPDVDKPRNWILVSCF